MKPYKNRKWYLNVPLANSQLGVSISNINV